MLRENVENLKKLAAEMDKDIDKWLKEKDSKPAAEQAVKRSAQKVADFVNSQL